MADYSKWDEMARAEEEAERAERERKRNQNREKYYKEQEERKLKYMQEQEAKKAAGHSHSHDHNHDHSHDGHSHSHGDSQSQGFPLLEKIRRPACGCGYADVDEMKRAAEAAKNEPQISAEEKTRKKIAAVHATREHGKQLFQQGDYAAAFAVYERGVLIVAGIFDLPEKEQQELTEIEVILDLNMAACKLKLQEWHSALEQCRMALQLDPNNVKAYFRIGQARIGLGEFDLARQAFQTALTKDKTGACQKDVTHQLNEIKRLEALEKQKMNKFTQQLKERMAKEAQKDQHQQPAEHKEDSANAQDQQ